MIKIAPDRIVGLDVARALAILGMVWAHVGPASIAISNGFPSALFAVLAGVSVGIMSSRGGNPIPRLAVRGLLIMAIGALLAALQMYVVVVLVAIGALIAALAPLTRYRTRTLWLLLAVFMIISAIVGALSANYWFSSDFFAGSYPFFAWMSYGIGGLLIHRLVVPAAAGTQAAILAGTLIPTAILLWLRLRAFNSASLEKSSTLDSPGPTADGFVRGFFSIGGHTGALGDVTASLFFALTVITACLIVTRVKVARVVLYPVHALGAMALSAYIAHVLTAQPLIQLGDDAPASEQAYYSDDQYFTDETFQDFHSRTADATNWDEYWAAEEEFYSTLNDATSSSLDPLLDAPGNYTALLATIIGLLAAASLWKLAYYRGPAEAALKSLETRALAE